MSAGEGANRFGPLLDGDGATFQLWAPDAKAVGVAIEGQGLMSMTRDAEGFWTGAAPARAGALYRFEVNGRRVPDPASRFQPQDVNDPSELIDPDAYVWRNSNWTGRPWGETVLYELHVGVLGGFQGMRERLKSIADLGVTAIELMPISDFAGAHNWGYDGVLPFAPASAYGRPDDLRALVDEAHGLGLMVFLDVVYNHFGPEGNWLPSYSPTFFDEAKHTPWGAAIDFHKPAVRRFFTENALYWLEDFRIDGLRLDAVHQILDRTWLIEVAAEVRKRLPDRHVHLVAENEKNDAKLLTQGFDAQWNDDFHNVLHVLLTGETQTYYRDFADQPARRLARCLTEGFIYQGEPSLNLGRPRGEPSAALPPTAFVSFLQNHDQVGNRALGERLTRLAAPAALKAAMALLLLCPQIPMLFMGEEVGAREPFLFFTDFHGDLAKAVREGRRREFTGQPGFSDEAESAKIPDPNAASTFEASRWTADAPDADEWRALVTELLALRRTRITPGLNGCKAINAIVLGEKAVLARWRLADNSTLTLAMNLGETSAGADLPETPPLFGEPADGGVPPFTTQAWIES